MPTIKRFSLVLPNITVLFLWDRRSWTLSSECWACRSIFFHPRTSSWRLAILKFQCRMPRILVKIFHSVLERSSRPPLATARYKLSLHFWQLRFGLCLKFSIKMEWNIRVGSCSFSRIPSCNYLPQWLRSFLKRTVRNCSGFLRLLSFPIWYRNLHSYELKARKASGWQWWVRRCLIWAGSKRFRRRIWHPQWPIRSP